MERLNKFTMKIVIVFLTIHGVTPRTVGIRHGNYSVCKHRDCQKTASTLLVHADFSVHPCDDFYKYACENFLQPSNLTEGTQSYEYYRMLYAQVRYRLKKLMEQPTDDPKQVLEDKAKMLYSVCMNTDAADARGTQFMEQIMENIGQWPMILTAKEYEKQKNDWMYVHNYFHRLTGTGSLINVQVVRNSLTRYVPTIQLDQPQTVFGKYDRIEESQRPIYSKFIKKIALILAKSRKCQVPEEQLEQDIRDVMDFRYSLMALMSWDHTARQKQQTDGYLTFQEWQRASDARAAKHEYENINWQEFVSDVYRNIPFPSSQKIYVAKPSYLGMIWPLTDVTPNRTILNHINLHYIETHMEYTTNAMRSALSELNEQLTGVSDDVERWQICLVQNPMQHVIARMYVREYFTWNAIEVVNAIIRNVREALLDGIRSATWLDQKAKESAIESLTKVEVNIGYPIFYDDERKMQALYENQPITYDNLLNVLGYEGNEFRTRAWSLVDHTIHDYNDYPTDINMFYDSDRNVIQISPALLDWPFFTPNLIDLANYATMGVMIGHELGHAFDFIARGIDENGNYINNWTNESRQAYEEIRQCIMNQYRTFVRVPGKTIRDNAYKTIDENIADAIGMRAALDAYKKISTTRSPSDLEPRLPGLTHYTEMQTFFLAMAGGLCNKAHGKDIRFRVKSFLNLEGFSEEYNCQKGTPMNPVHSCKIW